MALPSPPERPADGGNRIDLLAGLLIFSVVAIRRLTFLAGQPGFTPAALLLGLFFSLYLTEPLFSRRLRGYPPVYLVGQAVLLQALGLVQPYEDIWALLYMPLGIQAVRRFPRNQALAWGLLFAASLLASFVIAFGWISGLGRGLDFLAAAVFLVSFRLIYAQAEAARRESQRLLGELQAAHRKLQGSAAQAEALAAAHERERLAGELHDSVGQLVFSIALNAGSARLLLGQDPARAGPLLDRLQEQTGQALAQMRALIQQWRPGE
jgi:signal transduction histidine kinase